MTITEFLLARIAEREAALIDGWDSDGKARVATMWTGRDYGYTTVASDHGDDVWIADGREVDDARHVQILLDPARELAQLEAMRRIVDLSVAGCGDDYQRVQYALAAIWCDHPDYDEAWRA